MTWAPIFATSLAAFAVALPAPALGAFERAPLDAASAALGGITALSDDAVFGNPARCAGAAASARVEGRFDLSRPFGLAELSEGQVSLARAAETWGVGIGVRRFGADGGARYAERELRMALAVSRQTVAVGVAVRGLEASGNDFAAFRSVAVDAALLAHAAVDVGAAVEAVCGEVPGDPEGARRRVAAGAAREFGRSFRATLEVQRRGEDPLAGVVGLTWRPVDALALMGGLRQEPLAPSCGFSLRLAAGEVNVALVSSEALGNTYRVGVRLRTRG